MSRPVPSFSLTAQWARIKPTVMPKITSLLDAQACVGGAVVADFEHSIADFIGVRHAIGCSSGTSALWLALKALDLQPNSIVLTTPLSFIASASEIYAHGAHPVFLDIDPETLNLSPLVVADWLATHTEQRDGQTVEKTTGYPVSGMVVVNLFGLCANYIAFKIIAKQYGLWIVEDAAQSIGAAHNKEQAGTLGDISCFSFYPTKNLSACGDAGMVTTNDSGLADRLRRLRNHGRQTHYDYEEYGTNARLDAIQAVILQEKLAILPDLLARRQSIARRYNAAFTTMPGVTIPNNTEHTYHQYTLLINEKQAGYCRNQLDENLRAQSIGTRIFYPQLLCDIAYLQTDQRLYTLCPVARTTVATMLSLPIWPEMSDDDVITVIEAVKQSAAHSFTAKPIIETQVI